MEEVWTWMAKSRQSIADTRSGLNLRGKMVIGQFPRRGLCSGILSDSSCEWPRGCILWQFMVDGSLMAIPSGTKLGPYEVFSAIGAGGMGEVYQAHDTKLGRDVAIKVLPEAFAHDPQRLYRFQREAKMLASLNHPNIAAIYGLEEDAGRSYLVMELVPGKTLAERVKREGPVPVEEVLAIVKQIAEAVEAAHEKSIIHRDLKPANVKVTPQGKVKVLDFGLAKAFDVDAEQHLPSAPTLTSMGTEDGRVLGTPTYMSPEQA